MPFPAPALTRPIWAEISSSRLAQNFAALERQAGGLATLLCVVKANAYGHGIDACTGALVAAGAQWLGVTSFEEAVLVRSLLPDPGVHIVVLGGIATTRQGRDEAKAAIEHRLTPVVWEPAQIDWLKKAAAIPALAPSSVPVHLEIDTGMARQGIRWNDTRSLTSIARALAAAPSVNLAGIMTHYASPESFTDPLNALQTGRFRAALAMLRAAGAVTEIIHAGNSDTLYDAPQMSALHILAREHAARLLIRPGLALYGGGAQSQARGLSPALAWKTHVLSTRTIAAGDTVGYGSIFTATRATNLALVAAGYADGLSRSLSNRGAMLVRGRRAPIIGRISMDLATLDVSQIPNVAPGDEVILLGTQETESITAPELAALTGTIPYEVLCGIAARVPRIVVA